MKFDKIKSYAKINLALNIIGKTYHLHKIESIISFVDLHDIIMIKKIRFFGQSKKLSKVLIDQI